MPSKIADAFRETHVPALNPNPLDFSEVQELPDSYAWKKSDDYLSRNDSFSNILESVPVIDLTDPNALTLIGNACKNWGVFQVINHGISSTLFHDIECVASNLFDLPLDQKLKAARSPDGVSGYGVARISPFFSKNMWSEGFTILGSPLDHARILWPQNYTKFCDVIEEYQKQMKNLANKLVWLMLEPLGITKEDIKWANSNGEIKDGTAALQLNSYPVCPDPDRAMGLAAHTDSSLLTILYQNNRSGLEVYRKETGWVTVPPTPGTLVVNVCDLLHILTNGSYPSVLHRAMVNRTKTRLSFAYLYGPPVSVEIAPLTNLVERGHFPLYRPITWGEYLSTKAKHFDKALSVVKLSAPKN